MSGATMRPAIWLLAATAGMVACQTVATDYDKPARITDPSDASRAALQQTVNDVLNTEVLLADDALVNSSLLIVERVMPRTMEGSPAEGRTMEMPLQFRLVINGDDCILIDQRDDSRHKLANTSCIAEE
jgi:hypothetical protein